MQQIPPRLNDERLDYLDGLRGIAVLMVVLSHTSNNGLHIVPFLNMAGSGKVGVWLFFVLSAFLLTRKLDGKARRGGLTPGVCAEYAVHRVARIMPLLTLVLLGYLAAGRFTAQQVVEHLLLLRGDFIFWAIPVECYYYVVIPILVWTYDTVFRRRFGAFLALLVPLAIAGHVLFPPSLAFDNSINLLVYLSVFLCGSIIALTVTDPPRGLRPSRMAALAAGSCIFLLTPSILNGALEVLGRGPLSTLFFHSLGPVFGLLWAIVLLRVTQSAGLLRRAMIMAPLRWCGRISFSIYLLHSPIIAAVREWHGMPGPFKGITILVLATVTASLTYALVERPGIVAGRRFGHWLKQRLMPASPFTVKP